MNIPRQVNLLTALDPVLALVSSSPCYASEHVMHASRPYAYRSLCGDEFTRFRDLWEYTTDTAAWDERLASEYEAFRRIAVDRGVSKAEFMAHFQPENTMPMPVRVRRRFSTVEWRAPDTALPSQIVRLAMDMSRLIEQTASKSVEIGEPGIDTYRIQIPAFGDLRRITATAMEHGLNSPIVWDYLETMSINPRDYHPISDEIDHHSYSSISVAEARRIRLEYADRLERDVETLLMGAETRHQSPQSIPTDALEVASEWLGP